MTIPMTCLKLHRGRWLSYEAFQTDDVLDEEEEVGELSEEVEEANVRYVLCHVQSFGWDRRCN